LRSRGPASRANGFREVLFCGALAAVLSAAAFVAWGDIGLNPADEGFLWYGVISTAEGQVPMRDFESYEPARYYWSALFGSDLLSVRLAGRVFQGFGLFFGLLAARRARLRPAWLVLVALILWAWMFPRHKLFEPALAMMAVYATLRLLESPTARTHFWVGIYVGGAACFGRNHGFYAAMASLLAMTLLVRLGTPDVLRRGVSWAAGVALGFAPLLAMCLLVPGFAEPWIETVLFDFRPGTPFATPAPWPWNVDFSTGRLVHNLSVFSVGIAPLLVFFGPLFGLGVAWLTRREQLQDRALLLAGSFVGLFYSHHAMAHSDVYHFAQAIHPALLLWCAIPRAFGFGERTLPSALTWGFIALASLLATSLFNSNLGRTLRIHPFPALIPFEAAGEALRLPAPSAVYFERMKRVLRRHVGDTDELFIAPNRPVFYALLGKQSPVLDTYMLWHAPLERQDQIVKDLEEKDVHWALICDRVPAGREFRNTHPRVWLHLTNSFEQIADVDLPEDHRLLRRKRR